MADADPVKKQPISPLGFIGDLLDGKGYVSVEMSYLDRETISSSPNCQVQ